MNAMKTVLFLSLLFTSFLIHAQPVNTLSPVNKDGKGNNNTNNQNNTPNPREQQEMDDVTKAKMLTLELNSPDAKKQNEKLNVNLDSMYTANFEAKELAISEREKIYVSKVIPHSMREKLTVLDSSLIKFIKPVNTKFGMLELTKEQYYSGAVEANLLAFDGAMVDIKFSTNDILQSILPPLVIGSKPMSIDTYKAQVMQVFINYPGLVYFCDKGFLNLMRKNQFNNIMILQKRTNNIIDLTKSIKS